MDSRMKVMKCMSECYDDLIAGDYNNEVARTNAHAFMVQILEEIVDSKAAEMQVEDDSDECDDVNNSDSNVYDLAKEVYDLARTTADKINNSVFKEVKRRIEPCAWDSDGVLEGSILEILKKDTREWVITRGSNDARCQVWKHLSGYECLPDLDDELASDEDLMYNIALEIYTIISDDIKWIVEDSEDSEDSEDDSEDSEDSEDDSEDTEDSEDDSDDSEDTEDTEDWESELESKEVDISADITKNAVFKKRHCTPASRQMRYIRRRTGEKMT